mgnify:FL=1
MKQIRKSLLTKGKMARQLVYFCIWVLFGVLLWAAAVKTAALATGRDVDLSDVLTFAGAAFGGELLMLLAKRVFAKKSDDEGST